MADTTSPTWPTTWRDLPTTPPAGWRSGLGYPERRAFVEAQWHDAAGGDLEHGRHLHVGAACPREVSGIFQLDVRLLTFHWDDAVLVGIRKVMLRGATGLKVLLPSPVKANASGMINLPLIEHMHEAYLPVLFDTRACTTDGWKLFEVDAAIRRSDGVVHAVRLQVPLRLANGGRPVLDSGAGYVAAEGWMTHRVAGKEVSPFGYLRVAAKNFPVPVRRFVDDAATRYELLGGGKPGAGGRFAHELSLMACVNPDLHRHPEPYLGVPVLAETPIYKTKEVVRATAALVVGDRFMARVSDTQAGIPEGAAATLLVITVGQ